MVRRVVALALVLLAGATVAAASTGPARLRLAGREPIVITGRGFKPHERVRIRVRVSADPVHVRRATATAGGRFRARFGRVASGPCNPVWASARGSRGSRATLGRIVQPDCMVR